MYFIGLVDGSREGGNFGMGRLLLDIGPPISCYLSSPLNCRTEYIAFN